MTLRVLAALLILLASPVDASILPLLDESGLGTAEAWWIGEEAGPAGPVTSALVEVDGGAAARWVAPAAVGTSLGAVSRLIRTATLTPTNGARLAELLGAARALVGSVRREVAPDVPWLGLRRTSLVLDAALVDSRTGAEVRPIVLRAVAFGEDMAVADRAAARLLARFIDQATADVASPTAAQLPLADGFPVLVVRSDGSAEAYVAARSAIRESHPGVIDLVEVWATSGHVAMEVSLDEDVSWSTFRDAVFRLQRASLPTVEVRGVEDLGSAGLMVTVGVRPLMPEVQPTLSP